MAQKGQGSKRAGYHWAWAGDRDDAMEFNDADDGVRVRRLRPIGGRVPCLPTRSMMHQRPARCWTWPTVSAATSAKAEGVNRRHARRGEQVDRVAVAPGFEELPHRLHLQEARGFLLDLFHVVEQFQRLLFVLRQGLLEIALVPQMAAVDHARPRPACAPGRR